ncbi:hypothetical protein EDD85DRAFT_730560, partial [Armillaria nabsnona]
QLQMFIRGMNGTGKTQVLRAMIQYFDRIEEGYKMVQVAPMGTALFLVRGSTYHYIFRTNEFTSGKINKKTLGEVKARLEGVEYVFLGKVLMLSCIDLCKIDMQLAI